jgi:hypothetical protein
MDNDYEQEFMKLVGEFMEQGLSQQEAIEAARDELERLRNKFMASAPDPMDERNQVLEMMAMQEFGKPLRDLSEDQILDLEEMFDDFISKKNNDQRKIAQAGGIMSAAPDVTYERNSHIQKYMADGGRVNFQTGGVTESRTLPPEYVEALGKTYAADLTRQAGMPTVTDAVQQQPGETAQQFAQRQAQAQQFEITKAGMKSLAPQVAAQDPLQAAAYAQAVDPTKGLGSYQPFLTKAGTAADAATGLTGTGAGTGAGSIQSYMSPYQQQVIDATMADYDAQAKKSRLGLGAQAVSGGAFGSGRHGIAEAEFDALSNRGRASQLANLRQTGFQQAAQRRQQDLSNQMGIANLQQGLGGAAQDFSRAQISGLGTLGSAQQAQNQAVLDAQRQAAQMAVQDPQRRLNMLGSGVMGLMGGMGAGRTEIGEAPAQAQSSPLATALGVGLAGADIYGRIFGPQKG